MNSSVTIKSNITYQIKSMLLSLKKHMPSGQNSFFAQTGKENTRMRVKIVIYFVNVKVIQEQGFSYFDYNDQKSTCRRPPVTNINQRITYVQ